VEVVPSLDEAIQAAGQTAEAFIIGGAQIYAQAIDRADRLYVTLVDDITEGDTFFPLYDESEWQLTDETYHPADEKNAFPSRFLVFDRRGASAPMSISQDPELVELTKQLLASIAARDWKLYAELCDERMTCFEPEARGHLVEGLAFHKYYFDLPATGGTRNTTLVAPHVRMLGSDAAVVSYVRLIQVTSASGQSETVAFEETRVWQRINGRWKHVHFHRSANQ
jgi:calcium/calmodulin-dependent protein kinase (CaM kinase) II